MVRNSTAQSARRRSAGAVATLLGVLLAGGVGAASGATAADDGSVSGRIFGRTPSALQAVEGAIIEACLASQPDSVCPTTMSAADGSYQVGGLATGTYVVKAYPPAGSPYPPGTAWGVPVTAGSTTAEYNVLLQAKPLPSDTTLTSLRTEGGAPALAASEPFVVTTTGMCPGVPSQYSFRQDGIGLATGGMTEGPSGTYTAEVPALAPAVGEVSAGLGFWCPGEAYTGREFDTLLLANRVVDEKGSPVEGATVTLLVGDSAAGPFSPVPAGSGALSLANRNNPDVSLAGGWFGWDTPSGYYQLRAEKAGCTSVADRRLAYAESDVLSVGLTQPAVTLTLRCRGSAGGHGGHGGHGH